MTAATGTCRLDGSVNASCLGLCHQWPFPDHSAGLQPTENDKLLREIFRKILQTLRLVAQLTGRVSPFGGSGGLANGDRGSEGERDQGHASEPDEARGVSTWLLWGSL